MPPPPPSFSTICGILLQKRSWPSFVFCSNRATPSGRKASERTDGGSLLARAICGKMVECRATHSRTRRSAYAKGGRQGADDGGVATVRRTVDLLHNY